MRLAESATNIDDDAPPARAIHPEPLLVAGEFDVRTLLATVGLVLLTGGFAAMAWQSPGDRLPPVLAAIVTGLAACGVVIFQWTRRTWLSWTEEGFQLSVQGRDRHFLDVDVVGLATSIRPVHSQGNLIAERHELRLWTSKPPLKPWSLHATSTANEPAAFAPLQHRLQRMLFEKAASSLRQDGWVEGEQWRWSHSGLALTEGAGTKEIPADQISAADYSARELRIWRGVEPAPAVQLATGGMNVWLLASLLGRIAGRPGDENVPSATGLGRILREHRQRSAAIASLILAAFSGLVTVVCCVAAISLRMLPLLLLGGGVGLTTLAVLATSRRLFRSMFRLHESGISQSTLSGDRHLGFQDIDQFVFDARRQYSKGRYMGTLFTMMFASNSRPRDGIYHSERAAFETDDILQLRDRVADELATRMAALWSTGQPVRWTVELELSGTAVRFGKKQLRWTRSVPVEVLFSEIADFDVRNGWFLAWRHEEESPILRVKTSSANFYPGLLLFEQLMAKLGPG